MADELLDLIRSGKLKVGTVLYHPARRYPQRGREAVVSADGVRLGARTYSSLSGAVSAVIGGGAVNGWTFWRVKDTGEQLVALRRKHG
jgi:hypothetical protein